MDKSFQLANIAFTTKVRHYLMFEGLPAHLCPCANKVFTPTDQFKYLI